MGVALSTRVVGLRLLFLLGVVDHALVAGQVEDAVGREQRDRLADLGVHSEDVLQLQDLLGDDGGDAAGLH